MKHKKQSFNQLEQIATWSKHSRLSDGSDNITILTDNINMLIGSYNGLFKIGLSPEMVIDAIQVVIDAQNNSSIKSEPALRRILSERA